MAIMTSPYKLATDSPSRQLLWELNQLAISSQQQFYAHLDHENDEREIEHKRALARAAAEHESVRRSAEQFREQLQLQVQAERQRKEEEIQRELDKQRQEKLDRDEAARKREAERIKAVELEERRAAEARKADIEAAEKQKREKERRDLEVAQRVRDEQARREQEQRQVESTIVQAQIATIPTQTAHPASTSAPIAESSPPHRLPSDSGHEIEHARYLVIHKNLKEMRTYMNTESKRNPNLKKAMGEMRREIKKSVGQVREGKIKGQNTKQVRIPPL